MIFFMKKDLEIENLISKLNTSKDTVARATIAKMQKLGDASLEPVFKAAKSETNPKIRKWCLEAVGILASKDNPSALKILSSALREEKMTVRLHALVGLRRMGSKKSIRAIAKLLKDESGSLRLNALLALKELGAKTEKKSIQSVLGNEAWYVRLEAAKICEAWGIKPSKAKLNSLLKAEDRKSIREILERILNKS